MPDKQNGRVKDFSVYDTMETAQLEEILRLDAKSTEGKESDTDMLLYIMEVLADRKRKEGTARKTPEEAFRSFQENYLPCDCIEETGPHKTRKKPRGRTWRFPRSILAAAAALALIVGGVITAKGFGVDVWEVFLQWTSETFHFTDGSQGSEGNQPGTSSNLECEELAQVLAAYGVTESLVPAWLPEGYDFVNVDITETPKQKDFFAVFDNGENRLKISVKSYISGNPEQIEQSGNLINTYTVQGITYYIFEDVNQIKAMWINQNYECYISGLITVEEMKQIINSIKEG